MAEISVIMPWLTAIFGAIAGTVSLVVGILTVRKLRLEVQKAQWELGLKQARHVGQSAEFEYLLSRLSPEMKNMFLEKVFLDDDARVLKPTLHEIIKFGSSSNFYQQLRETEERKRRIDSLHSYTFHPRYALTLATGWLLADAFEVRLHLAVPLTQQELSLAAKAKWYLMAGGTILNLTTAVVAFQVADNLEFGLPSNPLTFLLSLMLVLILLNSLWFVWMRLLSLLLRVGTRQ